MNAPPARTVPRATARIQFHRGFTMDDGVAIVPYLKRLGISHMYASPLLTARPGSPHGYDIVDHNSINPELGGLPALHRLVAALRAEGMGLLLDIVPNHMGVGGADNALWLDVLEWGRASPYADFFDIDWDPPDPALRGRLLAPFLGSPYGTALDAGDIRLTYDDAAGKLYFSVYGEHRFPLAPANHALVLHGAGGRMDAVAHAFARLSDSAGGRAGLRAAAAAAQAMLRDAAASTAGRAALDGAIARFGAETAEDRGRLHALLERQHYRLAWWRAAADEINWRRFFDINTLAGVRVEVPRVFDETHALILKLYGEGLIDGVRIDHVDGLAEPRAYCRKLRRRMETAGRSRPPEAPHGAPYIVVEKILAPHERLAADWQTDGTTGYDFMDQVGAVLHDPAGEAPLTALWTELTRRPGDFHEEERAARRQILRDNLASELNAASVALKRIAARDLATRDFTLTTIRRALTEVLVHFPVYRIYAGLAGPSAEDTRTLDWAFAGAARGIRPADRPLLDVLRGWVADQAPRAAPAGPRRQERLRAMVRVQQLSSPTAAKSVEDTAFYRYGRLISRNEVGSNPGQFALPVAGFHAECRERGQLLPGALLATATHDHKRGEDTRARLAALSEIPEEWRAMLARWMRLNAPLRRDLEGGPAPSPADEIMLYETLVAAWPLDLEPGDTQGVQEFAERVAAWHVKAIREAKLVSEWAAPNEAYEAACRDFLFATLDAARPARLVEDIAGFAQRLAPAGAINGLAQTVLRMTAPGVPDLYQGADLWDFSLVDPDNRREVDYDRRRALLARNQEPASLLAEWRDGAVKQAVIARTLALRAARPDLFATGQYQPVRVEGPAAEHVIAFARLGDGAAALVAVTRLPAALLGEAAQPLVPQARWQDTALSMPESLAGSGWRNALNGAGPAPGGARIQAAVLFSTLPVAILYADRAG
jgi:(1->4)-alpha-D-glucan 1-alpha-D-glucosylmutase